VTWFILSLICLPAIFILAYPLLFRSVRTIGRNEGGMSVYRQQLNELDADIERGVLKEAEAEATKIEIQRRMLKLSADGSADASKSGSPLIAGILLLSTPVAAFILYGLLGNPDLPSKPLAERDIAAEKQDLAGSNLNTLVQKLAERLQEQPENLDGWILLARTLSRMERYQEAAETFLQATKIAPDDADLYVGAGENFYFKADGVISDDAAKAFEAAAKVDPSHAGARYYLALKDAQNGQEKAALDRWAALYEESDATAPYMRILHGRITEVAENLGQDVSALLASKDVMAAATAEEMPSPSEQDIQAAADMSAEDRQEMIQNMVARLAERMDEAPDFAGLMRLGNVYGTLGQHEKSAAAYGRAATLAPNDPNPLNLQAFALTQAAGKGAPPPPAAITLFEKVLTLDKNAPEALWYLGIVEAQKGNNEAALDYWKRLKLLAPADSQLYQNVTKAINALPQKQ
jgi:cytochrome c-type biogenesis protein CcmH